MMETEEILSRSSHRPWVLPDVPWVMFQQWSDLLFAHWAFDPAVVRKLVPAELELDLFEGKAWVAVTPFRMTDIRMRGLPAIPGAGSFLEMNLRTYVKARGDESGKGGVYFFSLDASNLPAVLGARVGFGLPYYWSDMSAVESASGFHYTSRRRQSKAEVVVDYSPVGEPIEEGAKSALEVFLTERYCLYEVRAGLVLRAEIHHVAWPLQKAEARFLKNTMGPVHGLPEFGVPDALHFSKQIDVLIYPPGAA